MGGIFSFLLIGGDGFLPWCFGVVALGWVVAALPLIHAVPSRML
jgi:hypothetical protein